MNISHPPIPGIRYRVWTHPQDGWIDVGGKSDARLYFNVATQDFELEESWNGGWLKTFKEAGFTEEN